MKRWVLFYLLAGTVGACQTTYTTVLSGSVGAHVCNDPTGTSLYNLTKLSPTSGCAVNGGTTDAPGTVFGVTVAGAGTAGTASVASFGIVPVQFDAAPTAGHYVTESSTAAGLAHDGGTNPSTITGPCVGQVVSSTPLSITGYSSVYNVFWRICNTGSAAGGGTINGSGTVGSIPLWTGTTTLGNSPLSVTGVSYLASSYPMTVSQQFGLQPNSLCSVNTGTFSFCANSVTTPSLWQMPPAPPSASGPYLLSAVDNGTGQEQIGYTLISGSGTTVPVLSGTAVSSNCVKGDGTGGIAFSSAPCSSATTWGGVSLSGTANSGYVPIATSSTTATWQPFSTSSSAFYWTYSGSNTPPASGQILEQIASAPAYPYIIRKQSAPAALNATFPTDFSYKTSQLVPDATTYPIGVVVTAGAINSATVNSGGTGYVVGDTVTVVQSGASGGQFTVTAATSGVVTAISKLAANWGTGYVTGTALGTTGGTGSGLTVNVVSVLNVATVTITTGALPIAPLVGEYAQILGSTTTGINQTPAAITAAVTPTTTTFGYTTTAAAGTAAGTNITAAIYDTQLESFQDAQAIDNYNGHLDNRGVNESGSLMVVGTIVQVSGTTNALSLPSITTLGCASGGVYPTPIGVLEGLVPVNPVNPSSVGNTGVGGFTHEGYGTVQMDSSTGLTAGDFIVPSTTTCYYGHDSGVSSYTNQTSAVTPVGAPIIGIISTVNGSTVRARFVDMAVISAGAGAGGSGTVTTTNTAAVGNVATILSTGTSGGNPTAVVGPGDITDTVGTGVTVAVPLTVNASGKPSQTTWTYNGTAPAVPSTGTFSIAESSSTGGTGMVWAPGSTPGTGFLAFTTNTSGVMSGDVYISPTGGYTSNYIVTGLSALTSAAIGTPTCMNGSGNLTVCSGSFLTNPMTALGDTIYGASGGTPTRLAGPTTNATWVLSETPTASAAVAPAWTNLNTTLSSYAPLASPTFTGTPIVPTATAGTNNGQAANTQFVATAIANAGAPCFFSTLNATNTMPAAATSVIVASGNIPANCIPANGVVHISVACTVSVAAAQTASTFTPQLVFYDATSTKTFPITATGATGSVAAGTSNLITGTADIMAPASGTGGSWGYGLVQAQNTSGTITNVAGLYNRAIAFVAQSSTLPTLIYGSTGNQIQVLMQTSVANSTANSATCNVSGHN